MVVSHLSAVLVGISAIFEDSSYAIFFILVISSEKFFLGVLRILYFRNIQLKLKIDAISSIYFRLLLDINRWNWSFLGSPWDKLVHVFYGNIRTNSSSPMLLDSFENYIFLVSYEVGCSVCYCRESAIRPKLHGRGRPELELLELGGVKSVVYEIMRFFRFLLKRVHVVMIFNAKNKHVRSFIQFFGDFRVTVSNWH